MIDPYGTEPMFDMAIPPKRTVKDSDDGKVRWRKYRPKNPVKCDRCIRGIMDGTRHGAAGLAAYKRFEGGVDEVLCFAHAQEQRDQEALLKQKEDRRRR